MLHIFISCSDWGPGVPRLLRGSLSAAVVSERSGARRKRITENVVNDGAIAGRVVDGLQPDIAADGILDAHILIRDDAGRGHFIRWQFQHEIGLADRPLRPRLLQVGQGIGPGAARCAGFDPMDQRLGVLRPRERGRS